MSSIRWLGAEAATNNTAELTAIHEAITWALHAPHYASVDIRYDSKYAAHLADDLWQPDTNLQLVHTVRAALGKLRLHAHVTFTHVKAHSNELWNERVDRLAALGARLTA